MYIHFKVNISEIHDFGLNLDMDGYIKENPYACDNDNFIYKRFDDKNDFIEELYRLNSVGLNIKGY